MSEDKIVDVGPVTSDNATLLLAAATELGLPIEVVGTSSRGVFVVPASVAKKAGLKYEGEQEEKAAAKKTAAKKTAAKKEE